LIRRSRDAWRAIPEVPVWRPVRGVIDLVLARPGEIVVACEVHTEIHRLEHVLRWSAQKAEALPSSESWSMLAGGDAAARISRLLVLRSTRRHHGLVREFEGTLRAAYPASTSDAVKALITPGVPWPGPAVIWVAVGPDGTRLFPGPPRMVGLGR
jgi:hypothetical protein